MTMNLPPGVTRDDLHAIGCMGLIEAAKKYDKDTEVVFIAVKEKKPLKKKYITKRSISIQVVMDKFGKKFKNSTGNLYHY